jgi:hypothetical protein
MSAPAQPSLEAPPQVGIAEYIRVTAILTLYCVGLAVVTQTAPTPTPAPSPERLVAPMEVLVGLTAFIWLLMVVVRNGTILRGITKASYYRDYQSDAPPEWVERPARTFNNLMQVPALFYVICLLMMVTGRLDEAQITLAWVFVVMRFVHAFIYIAWNYVPYRFAAWIAGCITLGVIWARFAF